MIDPLNDLYDYFLYDEFIVHKESELPSNNKMGCGYYILVLLIFLLLL